MAYNVLIVDDSQTIRAVLKKTLSMTGLELNEIFEAENGNRALQLLNSETLHENTCIASSVVLVIIFPL